MHPPADIVAAVERYAVNHVPTGGFLAAVIANDLHDALARADRNNLSKLPAIVGHVWARCPPESVGSLEAYRRWTAIRVVSEAEMEG